MPLSLRKNGLTSLFKEVRVFKVTLKQSIDQTSMNAPGMFTSFFASRLVFIGRDSNRAIGARSKILFFLPLPVSSEPSRFSSWIAWRSPFSARPPPPPQSEPLGIHNRFF